MAAVSDSIYVSYEPTDAARVATVTEALRGAGYSVEGAGLAADDAATAAALRRAWVVVVIWSPASTDRQGRHVLDEARAAAERGAYLGVSLDGAAPPFGFTGLQLVDMGSWSGGRNARLAALVEAVRRRMERLPVGGASAADAAAAAPAKRGFLIGAAVAIPMVVAAGFFFANRSGDGVPPRAQAIEADLASIPCAWLQVDPVDDGSKGRLALTGVADDPERAGETIRGLGRNDPQPATVTTDRVARIGSAGCPAIDVTRRLRRDDGGRMRILSDGIVVNPGMGLAEARVSLSFRRGDRTMILFGIEPSGAVTTVLPGFADLKGLAKEDVGYVEPRPETHEFSLRSDHVGWTGLILLVGDGDFAGTLRQGEVRAAADFARLVESGTAGGRWSSEMVWYKIEPR